MTRAAPSTSTGPRAAPTRGVLVLIADDEPVTVELMTMVLRHAGFEVDGVTICFDALERAASAPLPDVILLDAMMPFIAGLEVCRRLRAMPGGDAWPIGIFSSADETDVDWRGAGADGFLAKPFDMRALPQFVERLLASRPPVPERASSSDGHTRPSPEGEGAARSSPARGTDGTAART